MYEKDHISIALTYGRIGTLYFRLKNYEKAIENYNKSIEMR